MRLNMATFGACVVKIQDRGRMTDGEAKAILQETADRAEQMRRTGTADPFVAAAGELASKLKEQAQQASEDAIRNAGVRKSLMDSIDTNGGIANADQTLRSMLYGTNKGSRDNIQTTGRALGANWQAVLSNKLRMAGLEKLAITGELDKQIAKELLDMRSTEPKGGAVPGRNPARTIAEAILPAVNNAKDGLNSAGARIADALDYIAHTEHSPSKMRAAAGPRKSVDEAFAAWWKAEQPRWAEETFENVVPRPGESTQAARDRFGRSVYDALVSGVHMTPDGAFGVKEPAPYVPPSFEGSRNIARKVSQPRLIRYKDADAWVDHQRQFGTSPTLAAGIMGTLDKSARQVALMDRLGTNPMANFNQVIQATQEKYRDNVDGVRTFQGKVYGLKNVMGYLDGSLNIPANEMWAKIGASIRTEESISSLGGVGITHFASIWPTVQSELVHHGVPRLEALGNLMQALTKGRGSAERQEILADCGAYASGLARDMHSRWNPEDQLTGKLSALAGTFMKYTGIHYIFDNTQTAIREMLAHQLGRNASAGFDALPFQLSQMLGKYGIGRGEWDLLRNAPDLRVLDGRTYLTPRDAYNIDPAAAEGLLRSRGLIADGAPPEDISGSVDKLKQGISDKLLSYYQDASDHGVVTAGVREKAILLQGTRPGTAAGEIARFLAQFKMWPVAALSQVIGREIYLSTTTKEAVFNLGVMAALSTLSGYMRMSANDVLTGKPIRNPLDPKTLLAGLAQGGGLGIFGDYLFGETNRMGGGFLSTLAGPAIGDATNLANTLLRFREDATGNATHKNGQFGDLWPDLAHFGVRHIPFANLAYLKGTLDYMLWYHLFEAASPGWWERTNRRLEKEQGRSMVGYSPGGDVPYGVPGVFLHQKNGQNSGLVGQFFNQ